MNDRLHEVEFKTKKVWYFVDVSILNQELREEPLIVRKAKAIEYVAENLPVLIKSDELIVGNPNQCSVEFGVTFPRYATDEELNKARMHSLDETSVWGHHPPAWDKVINLGLAGIKQEIIERLERENRRVEHSVESIQTYRAMIISLDAVVRFARRHAEVVLREFAKETDTIRKRELFEIYKSCDRVPEYPATTYQDALQGYWLTYCMLSSSMEFIPLGRADQLLYPFFQKDVETNRITREYALDLTGSFLIKCNERVQTDMGTWEKHYSPGMFSQGLIPGNSENTSPQRNWWLDQRLMVWNAEQGVDSDANYNYGQSGNDWLMNLVLGGRKSDGTDATNQLSYLVLDLVKEMSLVMPTVSVRVHKHTPAAFMNRIAEVLKYGQGDPAIYNDDQIVEGFVDLGIRVEEANGYTNDGCWEALIPGKSYFTYAHVENLLCLEWVFNRGVSFERGQPKEGLDTGDPTACRNWDDFYEKYKAQVDARIDFEVGRRLANFGLSAMIAPDPLLSALIDDCVEVGKDCSQGGAKYNFHCIMVTGLSHTVDSLAVVKKLIFEEESMKMEELIDAIRHNWRGYEGVRARVQNRVPKFGNDDLYVDAIAERVLKDFESSVTRANRKQNRVIFSCGIGTFENYAILGRRVGASVDGRLARKALAPNYSPSMGCNREGPTAMFKSITRPSLLKYYCGAPIDIVVNANEFEGETGTQRMVGLIRSFSELGGNILTITSCSADILREAQKKPDQYRDLRVRMGGLSAYFVCMAPAQQENIIQRFLSA
jgi:formate C-acetyltransferase